METSKALVASLLCLLFGGCVQTSSYIEEQSSYVKMMAEQEGVTSAKEISDEFLSKVKDGYKEIIYRWGNKGDAEAQFEIGLNLLEGEKQVGFEKNIKEAIKWLEKAAENGNAQAASVLAALYEDMSWLGGYVDDDETATDHRLRLKWLKLGSELGNTDSMGSLAYSLEKGNDGEFNLVTAYAWAAVAETLGDSGLTDTDALKEKMTAVQLVEAKRQFESLLPKVRAAKATYCKKYPNVTMMVFRRASGSRPCVEITDSSS